MMQDIEDFCKKFVSEINEKEKQKVHDEISAGSRPSKDYFIMLVLSVMIATLGLLTNSATVIIGAMLVSPLLTPILGISLGAIKGDLHLFRQGIESEVKGITLALGIAIIITLILPNTTITNEILSRTHPTPLDLVIALASGAAGAYAICRKNISTTLPGIAIAVAVMPPVSVVGIGVALKRPDVAFGGLLMFAANVIAINLAGSFMFWLMGFSPRWSKWAEKKTMDQLKTSAILLLIILVPLAWIMWESINTANTEVTVERVLNSQIEGIEQARLVEYGFEKGGNGALKISATIDSPKEITLEKTDEMRIALEKNIGTKVELDLKVNEVKWIKAGYTS